MSELERRHFTQTLALHTAPTLLGIKCANLMTVDVSGEQLASFQEDFEQRSGLQMQILCRCKERSLLYVYHPSLVQMQLELPGVAEFLRQYGYRAEMPLADKLTHLASRMECGGFPHEIGIFLGYPLADVKGFIANEGRNCLLCGCWKVYHDPELARQTFANYDRCRTILCDKLKQGYEFYQALEVSKEEIA